MHFPKDAAIKEKVESEMKQEREGKIGLGLFHLIAASFSFSFPLDQCGNNSVNPRVCVLGWIQLQDF